MSEVCGTLGRWNTVPRTMEQNLINFLYNLSVTLVYNMIVI